MIELVGDTREPAWLKTEMARRVLGLKLAALHEGDWLITRDHIPIVGAERKEIKDFLASIAKDPRHQSEGESHESKVNRQLRELRDVLGEEGELILLLEGIWIPDDGYVRIGSKRLGWSVNAFVRKLEQLQKDFPGLVVLPAPGRAATVAILTCLVKANGGQLRS